MLLSRQATARPPARAAVPAGPSRPARGSAVAPLAAAVAAPPASLDVKSFKDGSSAGGTATLALSVAEADTAGAVVHRYIVLLRQNARAVSSFLGRGEGRECVGGGLLGTPDRRACAGLRLMLPQGRLLRMRRGYLGAELRRAR